MTDVSHLAVVCLVCDASAKVTDPAEFGAAHAACTERVRTDAIVMPHAMLDEVSGTAFRVDPNDVFRHVKRTLPGARLLSHTIAFHEHVTGIPPRHVLVDYAVVMPEPTPEDDTSPADQAP